jgi:hypothetical protein
MASHRGGGGEVGQTLAEGMSFVDNPAFFHGTTRRLGRRRGDPRRFKREVCVTASCQTRSH